MMIYDKHNDETMNDDERYKCRASSGYSQMLKNALWFTRSLFGIGLLGFLSLGLRGRVLLVGFLGLLGLLRRALATLGILLRVPPSVTQLGPKSASTNDRRNDETNADLFHNGRTLEGGEFGLDPLAVFLGPGKHWMKEGKR